MAEMRTPAELPLQAGPLKSRGGASLPFLKGKGEIMKKQVIYNPVRKLWMGWVIEANGNAEVKKTFKTEAAARKWAEA